MARDYRKKGLDSTGRMILAVLRSRGLPGLSTLELGCGVGGLTIELARSGAISATGMDLSPNMISTAKALAGESDVGGSITFTVGDGARALLPRADVVVLDAVMCCYPDLTALVANTSGSAGKYYAYSIPDDTRLGGRLLRFLLPLQSLLRRRKGFRFYMHPPSKVSALLERRGFTQIFSGTTGYFWLVRVYSALGSGA